MNSKTSTKYFWIALFGILLVSTPVWAEGMSDLASIDQAGELKYGSFEDISLENIASSALSPYEHYKNLVFHKLSLLATREYLKNPSRFVEGSLLVSFDVYPDGQIKEIFLLSHESNLKLFELLKNVIESSSPLLAPPEEIIGENGKLVIKAPFNFSRS